MLINGSLKRIQTEMLIWSLLELFCAVDDFCIRYEAEQARQLVSNHRKRGPKPTLSASEVMTIAIWFHCSGYRNQELLPRPRLRPFAC